jgi:hypothetical protein
MKKNLLKQIMTSQMSKLTKMLVKKMRHAIILLLRRKVAGIKRSTEMKP